MNNDKSRQQTLFSKQEKEQLQETWTSLQNQLTPLDVKSIMERSRDSSSVSPHNTAKTLRHIMTWSGGIGLAAALALVIFISTLKQVDPMVALAIDDLALATLSMPLDMNTLHEPLFSTSSSEVWEEITETWNLLDTRAD